MAVGIGRKQTDDEKNDYQELGTVTPRQKFLKTLDKMEQKFTKERKPFDAQCARADFSEQIEQLERESERRFGFISPAFIEDNIKMPELEDYGNLTRFDIEREDEDVEMQNINGLRSSIKTGVTVQYRCKNRGHGISVAYSNEIYAERFAKKKVEGPKEDTK